MQKFNYYFLKGRFSNVSAWGCHANRKYVKFLSVEFTLVIPYPHVTDHVKYEKLFFCNFNVFRAEFDHISSRL